MCDLMWGGWECINNHDDISVGLPKGLVCMGGGDEGGSELSVYL